MKKWNFNGAGDDNKEHNFHFKSGSLQKSLFILRRFPCLHGEHLSADITVFCIFFLITQVLFKDGLSSLLEKRKRLTQH